MVAVVMVTHLFSPVDDILWVVKPSSTGPADDRVVARWSMGDANGSHLLNWLAQSHTAQQQLPAQKRHHYIPPLSHLTPSHTSPSATSHPHTPLTDVARLVMVDGAAISPSYAKAVLVALGGVLSKVDACTTEQVAMTVM